MLRNKSFTETTFKNADQLIECATWRENRKPKPEYIVKPILNRIPSLAIRPASLLKLKPLKRRKNMGKRNVKIGK